MAEAIESVLAQTLRPFEIIIVDDFSSDGSQDLIKSYAQKHSDIIRPFFQNQNLGISRNKAFAQRQVRGDWLTYLDGDDRFLSEKLEREWTTIIENPGARVSYSNFYYINEKGERLHLWAKAFEPPSGYIFQQVFSRKFPGKTLFRNELVSSSCLSEVGYYDENRSTHEDWDFKIRLSKRYCIFYSNLPLIEYRKHFDSISLKSSKAFLLHQMIEVYFKNKSLLNDIDLVEKNYIEHELFDFITERSLNLIFEHISKGNRLDALKYCFEFMRWMKFGQAFKILSCCIFPSNPFRRNSTAKL